MSRPSVDLSFPSSVIGVFDDLEATLAKPSLFTLSSSASLPQFLKVLYYPMPMEEGARGRFKEVGARRMNELGESILLSLRGLVYPYAGGKKMKGRIVDYLGLVFSFISLPLFFFHTRSFILRGIIECLNWLHRSFYPFSTSTSFLLSFFYHLFSRPLHSSLPFLLSFKCV